MAFLYPPVPVRELPVSKNDDPTFNFIYKPLIVDGEGRPLDSDNQPTTNPSQYQYVEADFPTGATVALEVDLSAIDVLVVDATIDGSIAEFAGDHADFDAVTSKMLWRIVMTYTGGRDQVLVNGEVVRKDGRRT